MNTKILTNYVEITNTINHWNNPTLWVTFLGTIATCISAIFMYKSVQEMKKQRKLEYKRQEYLELKQEIQDNITPLVKEIQSKIPKTQNEIDVTILHTSNSNIYNALMSMTGLAEGTFYKKEIEEIFDQLTPLHHFIMYPYEYSTSIITAIHSILERIGLDLYKALTDDKIRIELIQFIQYFKNIIQTEMTAQDQNNYNKHSNEFNTLGNYIKSVNNKEINKCNTSKL
ncbi:MAG: hypothetical protein ACRC0X_09060 [Brevinema sp.]